MQMYLELNFVAKAFAANKAFITVFQFWYVNLFVFGQCTPIGRDVTAGWTYLWAMHMLS